MEIYTVVIDNHTTGFVETGIFIGDTVTVKLDDENGNPIEKTGIVTDILEIEQCL